MSQTAHEPPTAASRLRLAVLEESDALHADTPHPPAARVAEECDALADLFMSGGSLAPEVGSAECLPLTSSRLGPCASNARPVRVAPTPAARPPHAPVEAMVLGHLPVLASAWGPQYARALAAELARPVALVRFRAGTVSVELFGDQPPESHDAENDLHAGLARASRRAARWLVSVDATGEPVLADLLRSRSLASLTLLTGVDEAASVACYRTMKSMLGPDRDPDADNCPVRIAVMGSSAGEARESGDRLARAVETFLGFKPEVMHAGARIEPAPSTLLFRGPSEATLGDALDIIRKAPAPDDAAPLPAAGPSPATAPSIGETFTVSRAPAAPLAADATTALVSFLPGLRGLALRCPHARDVQFAAGPDGLLHALAWDVEHAGPPVASLAAAGAWATLNAELVAAACPGVVPSAGVPVTQHVFTRDAKRVRGLLDTGVKIHLVITTPAHPGAPMVAGELN